MKIMSWNVNGLRALVKKGGFDWLMNSGTDIICLQETKSHPDQLESGIRNPLDYQSFFDHSKTRKGYSGVAVYIKKDSKFGLPEKVEYGLNDKEAGDDLDQEGRYLELHFKDFVLFNVYFPNGGGGPDRLEYKMRFYDAFLKKIDGLRDKGKEIIFCGDINTAHNEIDLARPKENEKNTGFLRMERDWLDKVCKHDYVDVFRHFFPTLKDQYTWWDMKTFARERNVGWRIDYFFVTKGILKKIKRTKILDRVMGSDHCPIEIEF